MTGKCYNSELMDGSNNAMQKKNKDASATEQEVWLLPCRQENVRARSPVARGPGAGARTEARACREKATFINRSLRQCTTELR